MPRPIPFVGRGTARLPEDVAREIWGLIERYAAEADEDVNALMLNNLKAQAYDVCAAAFSGSAHPSGRVVAIKVPWRRRDTISGYAIGVETAGVTLTAGQNLMWLCNNNGVLVPNSVTGDQAGAWGTSGVKEPAVAGGPITVDTNQDGFLYVCVLAVGATGPIFFCLTQQSGLYNVHATKKRFGLDAATGVTAAQNITVGTMTGRENTWVGVY